MAAQPALTVLQGIDYGYGKEDTLNQLEASLPEGQITCLLGAAGCGKTTLMKILAGQLKPRQGRILMDGRPMNYRAKKQCAAVFSGSRLIDSLKIGLQLRLMLFFRGVRGEKAREQIAQALQWMELKGCESRYPDQLSDGEYQRMLISRALLRQPRLLILDEPFRGLDQALRQRLWQRLRKWQEKHQATLLFSSCQPEDAFNHAGYMLLMRNGKILQADTPHQAAQNPCSHYAAAFMKHGNILRGTVTGLSGEKVAIEMEGITLPCIARVPVMLGDEVALCVDCADLQYGHKPQGKIFLSGVIRECCYGPGGEMAAIELPGGHRVKAYCRQGYERALGSMVFLWWDQEKAALVPWEAGLWDEA